MADNEKTYKHECAAENAARFWEWIKTRGGVAVWESVNLSNPGASWSTPAKTPEGEPYSKPTWEAASEPALVVTDPAEIGVHVYEEAQRFHVAVRVGGQGMSLKVSDGGTRRIRKALAKHGEGATYVFDYMTQEAVILKPASTVSLTEWAATNGL